jgi:hypothetical protein
MSQPLVAEVLRTAIWPDGVREIRLTRGYSTIVDAADYERLASRSWCVANLRLRRPYAVSSYRDEAGRPRQVYMHRVILEAPADARVDHINGDGLDNRRCNLRFCTPAQNVTNSRGVRSSSGFRGVFETSAGRYRTRLRIPGQSCRLDLGVFQTAAEAARAYDDAARTHHGEFARLNFPMPGELAAHSSVDRPSGWVLATSDVADAQEEHRDAERRGDLVGEGA